PAALRAARSPRRCTRPGAGSTRKSSCSSVEQPSAEMFVALVAQQSFGPRQDVIARLHGDRQDATSGDHAGKSVERESARDGQALQVLSARPPSIAAGN